MGEKLRRAHEDEDDRDRSECSRMILAEDPRGPSTSSSSSFRSRSHKLRAIGALQSDPSGFFTVVQETVAIISISLSSRDLPPNPSPRISPPLSLFTATRPNHLVCLTSRSPLLRTMEAEIEKEGTNKVVGTCRWIVGRMGTRETMGMEKGRSE